MLKTSFAGRKETCFTSNDLQCGLLVKHISLFLYISKQTLNVGKTMFDRMAMA